MLKLYSILLPSLTLVIK